MLLRQFKTTLREVWGSCLLAFWFVSGVIFFSDIKTKHSQSLLCFVMRDHYVKLWTSISRTRYSELRDYYLRNETSTGRRQIVVSALLLARLCCSLASCFIMHLYPTTGRVFDSHASAKEHST